MSGSTRFEQDLIGDTSAHDDGTHLWLVTSAKNAIACRPVVALLVVTLCGALITGAASLLLVAPAVALLFFGKALFDGRSRQAAVRRAGAMPIRLPEAASFSDTRARLLIERLGRAREGLQRAVLAGPKGRGFDLAAALGKVPVLEREVVVLAARVEYLARFLGSADRCRAQAQTVKDLNGAVAELLGRAEAALRALEEVPARVTGLQLHRMEACDGGQHRAGEAAASLLEAFAALDQAVSDVPDGGGRDEESS